MFIQGMLVYQAGYELLGFTSYFHRFIYPSSFALQFKSINERINSILMRGNTRVIYNYSIYYQRAGHLLREEAIHQERRLFIEGGGDHLSTEGGGCLSREEVFVKRCSSREEAMHQEREAAIVLPQLS